MIKSAEIQRPYPLGHGDRLHEKKTHRCFRPDKARTCTSGMGCHFIIKSYFIITGVRLGHMKNALVGVLLLQLYNTNECILHMTESYLRDYITKRDPTVEETTGHLGETNHLVGYWATLLKSIPN